MLTSAQIRQQYLDFFVQKHGHTFVPSSPVVPHDDPTLLFTNAGMNQFKPYFLGTEKAPWKRVANTQKCIRAGGKHNDLDDVGRSRRHHTFFEMLGNWSFGDYFKRGAIEMSWELLTKVFKLDPERLHVTCYEGDEKNGVPRDTETANLWKEITGLPDDHIHYFGSDNFWEMGDTGPCGPCTEIYIDRTPDKTGGPQVNGDDPRVMEIWNNVFIQYNRNPDRSLTTLPAQHVDTGMGFERISQVLQNVDSNYEIDLFHPFWEVLKKLSGHTYGGKYPKTNKPDPIAEAADPKLRADIAFRVIADHIRCLTFAITDGATPSNEGRGYVLRRILRRAVVFGRQQLQLREPFMHTLVPVVVEAMEQAFPELNKAANRVAEIVKEEEKSFGKTLDRGIALFEEAQSRATTIDVEAVPLGWYQVQQISAFDAFKLHDTYGFPIDLTRIMAEERGMTVDIQGYEKLMEEAREKARSGGKEEDTSITTMPPDAIAKLQAEKIAPTNDEYKFQPPLLGGKTELTATVQAIWDGSKFVDEVPARGEKERAGEKMFAVIMNHTGFYAEMGGQVGDQGELRGNGANFIVKSTRTVGGYVLHIGFNVAGPLRVGESITQGIAALRNATQQNHTATHIANWALREVLGDGVQQKGSLVDPDKLRFDFSNGKALTEDEIGKVETLVVDRIGKKLPVYTQLASQEQALKINSLRAVFGEKYPPMVRVVSVGVSVDELLKDPTNAKWREFSIEFCGGTHLKNSADVQSFAITSEESVSKGVRRLVALTGASAASATQIAKELDAQIAKGRAASDADRPQAITALQKQLAAENLPLLAKRRGQAAVAELQSKQKAFEKSQKQSNDISVDIAAIAAKLIAEAAALGSAQLLIGEVSGANDDQLRAVMDSLRKKSTTHGIMLGSASDGKVSFVSAVSDDLIAKGLKAGDWIRETAKIAGGGGGGRPQMAQAGGKDPAKLGEALKAAREYALKLV